MTQIKVVVREIELGLISSCRDRDRCDDRSREPTTT